MKPIFTFYLFLTFSLFFVSCSKTEWKQTEEGYYFYDKTKSRKNYSWTGETFGGVAHGEGTLIAYNKNKSIVSEKNCIALYGAMDSKYYSDSRYGKYLGKGKNKRGYIKPKGYGVLIIDKDYPDDAKELTRFSINTDWLNSHQSVYIGNFKKGLFSDFGRFYEKTELTYEGYWRKGEKTAVGKEYVNGVLLYSGYFKQGKRDGFGEEFAQSANTDSLYLKYSGEWKNNIYNGYGKLYNEYILIYEGNWKDNLYDGKGKLYSNGECIEGKWEEGINSKIYTRSLIDQALTYFGHEPKTEETEYTDLKLAENDSEFIDELMNEIHSKIETEISHNIDKRFGFWGVFRMYYQYIFTSDVKRMKKAEKALCKGLNPKELTKEINAKIYYYNENHDGNLSYIKNLKEIPEMSIVNPDLALKILDREAMEVTDGLVGVLLDIIICFCIGFIIGFIIGLFFPALIPYCGIIDLILAILSIIAAIVILFIYGSPIMTQMEVEIKQMLIYNFQLFIDSQNIIQQIIA